MRPILLHDISIEKMEGGDVREIYASLSSRYPRGFPAQLTSRLDDLAEHDAEVALAELTAQWAMGLLNEVRGYLVDAGARREPDGIRLWVEFHHEEVAVAALQLAAHVVFDNFTAINNWAVVEERLQEIWAHCRRLHPDYQARILMVGARELGIPVLSFVPNSRYWQFGWGNRGRVFLESASNADGLLGGQWQKDKVFSKKLLVLLGMPTPPYAIIRNHEDLVSAVKQIGYPCVVKPVDQGGGKGVTANIRSDVMLENGYAHARAFGAQQVMLEKHVAGDDYRLMVVDGKFMAGFKREASSVVGDGQSTVAELIAELNVGRSANIVSSGHLRPIVLDKFLADHLAAQGLEIGDRVPVGRRVALRGNANVSTGGISTDVTDEVHAEVRAMAEQLAQSVGLATAGVDYLTADISRSPVETGGVFIELNCYPGLDVCIIGGWSERAVSERILGDLVGVVCTRLKIVPETMLEREHAHLMALEPEAGAGWVCGSAVRVGDAMLQALANEPWGGVRAALRNRSLSDLNIVCSAEDIIKNGLPLDRFREVIVEGVELPAMWRDVINQCIVN
jgi:cyanophycin synthetase